MIIQHISELKLLDLFGASLILVCNVGIQIKSRFVLVRTGIDVVPRKMRGLGNCIFAINVPTNTMLWCVFDYNCSKLCLSVLTPPSKFFWRANLGCRKSIYIQPSKYDIQKLTLVFDVSKNKVKEITNTMAITLRECHQRHGYDAMKDASKGIVKMFCGTGKTALFTKYICDHQRDHRVPTHHPHVAISPQLRIFERVEVRDGLMQTL